MTRSINAWIVYWEYMPGRPVPGTDDGEVVAVLPGNTAPSRVSELIYRLWAERSLEPSEMLLFRREEKSPYRVQPLVFLHRIQVADGGFMVGHNPVLVARKAERVRRYGNDGLQWEEVGPVHGPSICAAAGEPNCVLVGKEPHRREMRWQPPSAEG